MPPKRNSSRGKPHNKNSSSATATANISAAVEDCVGDCLLPKEAMLNILSRLPVKSLVRFKAVCKPWLNLMTNPRFIALHHHRFSHAPKTVSTQSHHLKCPTLGINPNTKITNALDVFLETCKGLVCMARLSFTKEIALWNPATNLWKWLPRSKTDFFGSAARVSLGFGCNVQGDDHKVVRIFCSKGKKMKVGVEVYSSKSDSWKTIGVAFKFRVFAPKNYVIANGNPYWIAIIDEKSKIVEGKDSQVLLGFDTTKMSFYIVPLPRCAELGMGPDIPFVDWKGSLSVLECVKRDQGWLLWINVWVFDHGVGKWRKKETLGPGGLKLLVDRCLECSNTGKIVVGCQDGTTVCVYDPIKKCVSEVSKLSKEDRNSFQMLTYNESLAYVRGMKSMLLMKEESNINKNEVVAMDGFFASYRGAAFYYPSAF